MWILSNMMAQQAASLGSDGKGISVIAEETRTIANFIQKQVERAIFDNDEIQPNNMRSIAFHLNILTLNCAFECSKIGERCKPAVVCDEDIRLLAREISNLFGGNSKKYEGLIPLPKERIKSIDDTKEFLLLKIAGIDVVEYLANIEEVCTDLERTDTHVKLRGMEVPLIDVCDLLNKLPQGSTYVIFRTPWAKQNKVYAVAADINCIFHSSIGIPKRIPKNTPLSPYLREYWESENEMPFMFMNWPKMA